MTDYDWFVRALFTDAIGSFAPDIISFSPYGERPDYSEPLRQHRFCRLCFEEMMRHMKEVWTGETISQALNEPMALYETLRRS